MEKDTSVKEYLAGHKVEIGTGAAVVGAVALVGGYLWYRYRNRPDKQALIEETLDELATSPDEEALTLHAEYLINDVGSDEVARAADQLAKEVEADPEQNVPVIIENNHQTTLGNILRTVADFARIPRNKIS